MFDLDTFVADCKHAVERDATHMAVSDLLGRAMDDPDALTAALGEPTTGGLHPIYQSDTLTIVNVVWPAGMTIMPHNHEMWAAIGIYGGREDNIFWRRVKDDPDGRIEAAGVKVLSTGDFTPLGPDIVHSVTNPLQKLTGAIHIYGGDFFETPRSEWDPESLQEQPYDATKLRALISG